MMAAYRLQGCRLVRGLRGRRARLLPRVAAGRGRAQEAGGGRTARSARRSATSARWRPSSTRARTWRSSSAGTATRWRCRRRPPAQFVASEAALAALDVDSLRADGVQTAALLVPSLRGPSSPRRSCRSPPLRRGERSGADGAGRAPRAMTSRSRPRRSRAQAVVIRASVSTPRSAEAALVRAAKPNASRVAKVRPQAVAMLDRKLLSDTTLGDLMSGARCREPSGGDRPRRPARLARGVAPTSAMRWSRRRTRA